MKNPERYRSCILTNIMWGQEEKGNLFHHAVIPASGWRESIWSPRSPILLEKMETRHNPRG